jgi:hypothetical protein
LLGLTRRTTDSLRSFRASPHSSGVPVPAASKLTGARVHGMLAEKRARERKREGTRVPAVADGPFIGSEGGGTHLGAAEPPESATEELPRSGGGRRCPPRVGSTCQLEDEAVSRPGLGWAG